MRKLLLLLLLLLPSEVWAGQIEVTAGPSANTSTYKRVRPISDADLTDRVIPALKWHYGQICNPPAPCRDRTNTEAVDAWLKSVNDGLNDIITRYDTEQAKQAIVLPPLP